MTILPPPSPKPRHECPGTGGLWDETPMFLPGTLMECAECGRWWKYREQYQGAADKWTNRYWWVPVSSWDISARRRIAADKAKRSRFPVRWWDCPPNPK